MLARKLGMLDTDSSDLCKSSLIASAFSESIRYNVPCLLLSFTLCIRHLTFLIIPEHSLVRARLGTYVIT